MRTVTPSSLKWLIDKKARIQGEILKAQKKIQKLQAENAALIAGLEEDLLAVARIISLHEIPINPQLIEPCLSHTAGRRSPYGKITVAIFRCLKAAAGEPCSTSDIVLFIKNTLSEPPQENEFFELRVVIRKRLNALAREGKIRRLHPVKTTREGYWASFLKSEPASKSSSPKR